MVKKSGWNVNFSLKNLLLWLTKSLIVLTVVFWSLYFYTYLAFAMPTLSQWMIRVKEWDSSMPQHMLIPLMDGSVAMFLPVLTALLLFAVLTAVLTQWLTPNRHIMPDKKRRNGMIIAAILLILCLLFSRLLSRWGMELISAPARFLPRVNYETANLVDSDLPARFTLYFSLLFALTYHLVKLCASNLRRKPKADTKIAESTQTNEPTPALHTN